MAYILEVADITRQFTTPRKVLTVLGDINFKVESGLSLAIIGSSGSGKSTLLGLCAGLDQPTAGRIKLAGSWLDELDEDGRARLRNKKVGFIFQDFQLIPTLTALENVMIPMELLGLKNVEEKASHWLKRVGLGERMHHYPNELSGGEQQRVSLARAFANEPEILFADEPTGNLDETTGTGIEQLLFELNAEKGTTLIIVTHDPDLAAQADRVIRLKGGHMVDQYENKNG